jgi:hypothetical protein
MNKEEKEMNRRKITTKRKSTSIDSRLRWIRKDKCNRKRGDRKENISRRCSWRMKRIELDRRMTIKSREMKMLELNKNTKECLKIKKMINKKK